MQTSVEYKYSELSDEWLTSVEQEAQENQYQMDVMKIGRLQDPTIPTDNNASDRTNMPLSGSSTREGILRNYYPAAPSQDPSHNVTFE